MGEDRGDGPGHAQALQGGDGSAPAFFGKKQSDLASQPLAGHCVESPSTNGRGDGPPRLRLQAKAQTLPVPHTAQRPRGVVAKGFFVQGAQNAALEIRSAAEGIDQAPLWRDFHRDRVDREIAAPEILLDRGAEGNRGQSARVHVRLAPCCGHVEPASVGEGQDGGCESWMQLAGRAEPGGEALSKGGGIPVQDEVDVANFPAQEEIAHDAADQIETPSHADGLGARRRDRRPGRLGQPGQRGEVAGHGDPPRRRTRPSPPPPAPGSRWSAVRKGRCASNPPL